MRSTLDGIATRRLNACNRFLRAAVALACLSVVKIAVADANTTGSVAEPTDVPEYGFIEQRIYRGESGEAQEQLEGIIEQLESAHHRYHEDLVVPLALLGDALMVQQEYDAALDKYDLARHLARVNYGLFDARQIPIVYREADAFKKIGDLASSGQREEYAFEILRKLHGASDSRMLQPTYRLARFYLDTYNILAARVLYERAVAIHEENGNGMTTEAIHALSGIALSHKLERFPPFYVSNPDNNTFEGPRASLRSDDIQSQQVSFNNFPAGERALQKIVQIRQAQEPEDKPATLAAMLELADWHLMFGRKRDAATLYTHIFEEMAQAGEDADAFFADPALLYFPRPENPKPPAATQRDSKQTGRVKLQFDITPSGRIRRLETLESQPPKLMDFRVRRSMRSALYRPRLIAGTPVEVEAQTYTHEFTYFPRKEPPAEDGSELETDPASDAGEAPVTEPNS